MRSESEWTESYDCGCGNSAAGPEGQLDKASLAVRELDIIRLREGNSLGYGKTTAKSLGIPYALISLSKSCGLLSDLEEVFGERGRDLLYYATCVPNQSRDTWGTNNPLWLKEYPPSLTLLPA